MSPHMWAGSGGDFVRAKSVARPDGVHRRPAARCVRAFLRGRGRAPGAVNAPRANTSLHSTGELNHGAAPIALATAAALVLGAACAAYLVLGALND